METGYQLEQVMHQTSMKMILIHSRIIQSLRRLTRRNPARSADELGNVYLLEPFAMLRTIDDVPFMFKDAKEKEIVMV